MLIEALFNIHYNSLTKKQTSRFCRTLSLVVFPHCHPFWNTKWQTKEAKYNELLA